MLGFMIVAAAPAAHALDAVSVRGDAPAIDLTGVLEHQHSDSDRIQVSTAPGTDGIVRRIEVRAREGGQNWVVFALANNTDINVAVSRVRAARANVQIARSALLPTLDANAGRRELANPAAYLPVLLFGLAAIGMLWADVSWHDRLGGLSKFLRLLWIPVLLIHFRRSERGLWVIYGFFAASVALLVVLAPLASALYRRRTTE